MKRVVIESPYSGEIEMNKTYGRFAMHDCLVNHNESPYASHLLYTQDNVLRDHIQDERNLGIQAGFYWRDVAEKSVFYVDLGMTSGMQLGIEDCEKKSKNYEIRRLPDHLWNDFSRTCRKNGLKKPERKE
jgi:hypothetical protein